MFQDLQSIVHQSFEQMPSMIAGIPQDGSHYDRAYIWDDLSPIYGEGWIFVLSSYCSVSSEDKRPNGNRVFVEVYNPPRTQKSSTMIFKGNYEDTVTFLQSPQCEQRVLEEIPMLVDNLRDTY